MTDRDELDAFDDDLLRETASEHDVAVERLTRLARTHQSNVRDLPGVDDIVYEWRKAFAREPLLERREDAYLLAVPNHVWPEFAASLSLSDAELLALREVHERQVRTSLRVSEGGEGADGRAGDDREGMVLTRP